MSAIKRKFQKSKSIKPIHANTFIFIFKLYHINSVNVLMSATTIRKFVIINSMIKIC